MSSILPNQTVESVNLFPNEYATNIVMNRGFLRLLENDFALESFIAELSAVVSELTLIDLADLTGYILSSFVTLTANSGNWQNTWITVSELSSDWVLTTANTFLEESINDNAGVISASSDTYYIPNWLSNVSLSGNQHLQGKGFGVNNSDYLFGGNPGGRHWVIPTENVVKDLLDNASTLTGSFVQQYGTPATIGNIPYWSSTRQINAPGYSFTQSIAGAGLSGQVASTKAIVDYAVSGDGTNGRLAQWDSTKGLTDTGYSAADYVRQSGSVIAGNIAIWNADKVIQDGGVSINPFSSAGVLKNDQTGDKVVDISMGAISGFYYCDCVSTTGTDRLLINLPDSISASAADVGKGFRLLATSTIYGDSGFNSTQLSIRVKNYRFFANVYDNTNMAIEFCTDGTNRQFISCEVRLIKIRDANYSGIGDPLVSGVLTPASSPGWTVNALIGQWADLNGTFYVILSNTASSFTIDSPPGDGNYNWSIGTDYRWAFFGAAAGWNARKTYS